MHLTGAGRGSGVEVDLRFYMHWKLRDGKMVYLFEYADRDEALMAAGLSEQARPRAIALDKERRSPRSLG